MLWCTHTSYKIWHSAKIFFCSFRTFHLCSVARKTFLTNYFLFFHFLCHCLCYQQTAHHLMWAQKCIFDKIKCKWKLVALAIFSSEMTQHVFSCHFLALLDCVSRATGNAVARASIVVRPSLKRVFSETIERINVNFCGKVAAHYLSRPYFRFSKFWIGFLNFN